MRLSYHLVGTFIVGLASAVGQLPSQCLDNDLSFNKANAATLAGCTELAYRCDDKVVQINSTKEAVPANCTHHLYNVTVDGDTKGPLSIPGMAEASSITVSGTIAPGSTGDFATIYSNNITVLDLPDLENITSNFMISDASSLTTLNVPKLKNVTGFLDIDLSGGPAVRLSFASLIYARAIVLSGNIDAVDFPVLSNTLRLEVHTTGKLDCPAFADKMSKSVDTEGHAVICGTETSDTTSSSAPPTPTPTGNSVRFGLHGGFLALAAFIACLLVL